MFISDVVEYFLGGILHIIKVIVIKDPCKKCLVKACCSDRCNSSLEIEKLILPYQKILYAKIEAWVMVCTTLGISCLLIMIFIKDVLNIR